MKLFGFILAALMFVVSPGPSLAASADGAILVFKAANIARARSLIEHDPVARTRWAAQRQVAEAALAKPPTGERQIDAALEALALSYRITDDRRFAEGARQLLLKRAAQPDWLTDLPVAQRDPPWHSDLGMGFSAESFGIAYDAIRDTLSPADRATLVRGLVRGAIEPVLNDWVDGRSRIHALDTMGHNWWSHIVFGTGVGVLAILRDEPRAAEWARRIDAASVEWARFAGSRFESKPQTIGDDGASSETVGYAELGLHNLLLFRRSWVDAMGRAPSPIPALAGVPDYFLATAYPGKAGWVSLDFGDSRPPSCGCYTLADLWALGDHNPAYLPYIAGFAGVPDKDAWGLAINLPYLPDTRERAGAAEPTLPTATMFASEGLVTLRSGWGDDATLLAMRSGLTWNHDHADAGSFILYHHGQTLLADSGHSGYATPEYDGYFRQSIAHNVVTIDGKAEPPGDLYDGSHFPGVLDHLIDAPGFRYVWADATGPTSRYFQRNYRNLLWIGDTILVIDDVRSWDIGQFEWLLHYQGAAKRSGQTIRITQGAAAVDVRPLFPTTLPDGGLPTDYPEDIRLVEHQGLQDGTTSVTVPYLGLQPSGKGDREKFLVAIQPVEPGRTPSRVERLEGLNWIGVRITGNGRVTELYLNLLADGRRRHRNANATLGGFDTDAYLLGLSWRETGGSRTAPDQLFVADGSYVRRDGTVLLDSLSKIFAHVDIGGEGRVVGSFQPDAIVRVACRGPVRVAERADRLSCHGGLATLPPARAVRGVSAAPGAAR